MKTNPSTYAYINKPGYYGVHAKGEVWAAILLEPYWELVTEFGFSPNWFVSFFSNVKVQDTSQEGQEPQKCQADDLP